MYKAIYRRWRSRTFDDLKGQDQVSQVIKKQCATGSYAHAYLFCGTRGTGKTSTARILAKAVNCLDLQDGNPCCACTSCIEIENGMATDVVELDAASNNSVNDVRDLCDELIYPPTMLKKRVYIIDEAHMLSTEADNALLKTLEEPPEHVIFILATTEHNKIPATIMSRCQRFEFRRIDESFIIEHLKMIAESEKISLDDDAAALLARLADGSMRDAQNLLESCIAAGADITAETVSNQLGLSGGEVIRDFFQAIAKEDITQLLRLLGEYYKSARSLPSLFGELLVYIRNALYQPYTGGEVSVDINPERLLFIAGIIQETLKKFTELNIDKKLIAELALYKMSDSRLCETPSALIARIEALERRQVIPQPQPQVEEKPITRAEQPPAKTVDTPYDKTAELAELINDASISGLVQAAKITINGDNMVITSNAFATSTMKLYITQIKRAVCTLEGRDYELVFKNFEISQNNSSVDELL